MTIWQQFPDDRLLVEASLWSADFTCFAQEMERVDPLVDMYHIDVSDGGFVPGFLFFADLVKALRQLTQKPFHVHLMTVNPLAHIPDFLSAGADLITIQAENGPLVPAALDLARKSNVGTGIALGLDTLPETIEPLLDMLDMVLMMGTPLGIKGVQPSPFAFRRIERMKELILRNGLETKVKIFAGADGVIAGSLVFKSLNLDQTISWLHGLPMEVAQHR